MVSHMAHKSHVKFISFNATMFHEVLHRRIAFIDQRAAPLVKKTNTAQKNLPAYAVLAID